MLKNIQRYRSIIFSKFVPQVMLQFPQDIQCLHFEVRFSFGFFKTNWKSKDYMITNQIKASLTSQQLKKLIHQRGEIMNLINLTAILDRIEEQQMLNTSQIIDFVIEKLKRQESLFLELPQEATRPLCNIICYLGNLKNQALNYIFQRVDYFRVIKKVNRIEKTMLINGLIRLQLFHTVFVLKPKIKKDNQLYFSEQFLFDLNTNQLLSIWLAFCDKSKLKNQEINEIIINVLTAQKNKENEQKITLKTYAYALICYTEMYRRVKLRKSGRLYEIVRFQAPQKARKKQFMLAHQMSHFLKALTTFQKKMSTDDKSLLFSFPNNFQTLLNLNFKVICQNRNTTLRNIANIYKYFSERFKLNSDTLKVMCQSILSIIQQQIQYISKREKYSFEHKIDFLSLCSLTWKLNQLLRDVYYFNLFKETLVMNAQQYILSLKKFKVLEQITTKELLMFYSGLYLYGQNHRISLLPQFQTLTVNMITNQNLKLTLKELTLFYTYFKQIKIVNSKLCHFFRNKIKQQDEKTMTINKRAEQILEKKGCLMNMGKECLNCFNTKTEDK